MTDGDVTHADFCGVNRPNVDYIAPQHNASMTGAAQGRPAPIRPRRPAKTRRGEADDRQGHDRARNNMHPDPSDTSPTAGTVLTFVAMTVICVAIVIGLCIRLAERFEPTVGDIADFSSRRANQDVLPVNVTAQTAGHTCELASDVMARNGGSFVIVARHAAADDSYLIHWAGSRTSNGARDCGSSADLLVSKRDLLGLAGTVGGFGVRLAGSKV